MRFVYQGGEWVAAAPTDGALLPWATERVTGEALDSILLAALHAAGDWLKHSGLPLAVEGLLIAGLACLVVACSGSGTWLRRGAKLILFSIMLGVVRLAV